MHAHHKHFDVIFKIEKLPTKTKCFLVKLPLIKVQKNLNSKVQTSWNLTIREFIIEDGNSSENLIPKGTEEWQFNIPQGSRKIKSIPKGSSGNFRECNFLNSPQCSMLIKRKFKIFFSILYNFEKFLTAWWSENHYEKKVYPKFFQNPFLGCPWVV